MEAFSLLKYWRSGGSASGGSTDSAAHPRPTTKTIVTAAAVSPYSSDGEEGPYFDLEFAIPDPDSDADENPSAESQETDDEDETESGSSDDTTEEISMHEEEEEEECTDQNATFSPSDELFSQGNLVKVEPSTILLNGSDDNFKFPVSLVKSATKFRVLLLKLKKSKSGGNNGDEAANVQVSSTPKIAERESHGKVLNRKFLAVKFRVEEVPLVSLFTRDTSSKEIIHGRGLKTNNSVEDSESNAAPDERKLTKEVVQKYLKMVKPFYVRVSKLKFPGGGPKGCAAPPEGVAEAALDSGKTPHVKQGNSNLQAGLEVVRKHLGKSRSASAAVAEAPPGKAASNRRRDDSLLQVQDGIQGAILHCKRSFNAASGGDVESSSILCRSVSDPSYEKSMMMQKAPLSSSFSGEAKLE